MILTPLGTNGFFPSFNRQTMCFAIPHGTTLIILDAGSGLFRLAEPEGAKLLEGITDIHLYLSHYHLDHTFGFYAAFKFFAGKKVTVFGKSDKRVFKDMTTLEYVGDTYPQEYEQATWKTISPGIQALPTYSVVARRQEHNGVGSLAFRFIFPSRSSLAYVTDSEPTDDSVSFCREVSLLLHEHYLTGDEALLQQETDIRKHSAGGHTTTIGAALVAKYARVSHLALIHHHPFHTVEQLSEQETTAKKIFPSTSLAHDCTQINF